MRRQLETTLENLQHRPSGHLFSHNSEFGAGDRYLDRRDHVRCAHFSDQGLIKAIGMRGPHRFARDRLNIPKDEREDKYVRFRRLFGVIGPDYLAVRFNALTPVIPPGQDDIFALAAAHGAERPVNKPLAQGLLTGKYHPGQPPRFGPGDHRLRKAGSPRKALHVIGGGLQPLRDRFGPSPADLVPVMLRYCLEPSVDAAVLVGFTTPRAGHRSLASPPGRSDRRRHGVHPRYRGQD